MGLCCLWSGSGEALAEEAQTHPLAQAIEVGTEDCIRQDVLVAGVEVWLGRGSIDARLSVVVEELPDGQVRLLVARTGEQPGRRLLEAGTLACADRRAAVALAIAMAIDAAVLQTVVQLEEEPEPEPEHPPQPPKPAPPKPAPPKPAPPRPGPTKTSDGDAPDLAVESELRLMGLYGVLPEPALAGFFGLVIPVGPRLALRLGAWTTQSVTTTVANGHAEIAATGGELDACLTREDGALRVRGCAGVAAARWTGRGKGFQPSRTANVPWVAVQSGLELGLRPAEGVILSVRADAQLPVLRPAFQVHDAGGGVVETSEPPAMGLRAGPGLTIVFD